MNQAVAKSVKNKKKAATKSLKTKIETTEEQPIARLDSSKQNVYRIGGI